MKKSSIVITTRDGYTLHATLREPNGPIKAVIQLNSGTGVPQEVYGHLASYLSDHGYVSLTYDYRGIGASAPRQLKGFQATLRDWGYLDMTSVFDWILTTYPHEKKILIGHSMGGQLIGLMDNANLANQIIMIAASTGYWKDMTPPLKWVVPVIWYFFIPYTTAFFGYAKAKKIQQGENLPKGVALEWRSWCTSKNYFGKYLEDTLRQNYFGEISIPIKSIQIEDDPIANCITVDKLLAYYSIAPIQRMHITPRSIGEKKLGHFGYFSRRVKDTLWQTLLHNLKN